MYYKYIDILRTGFSGSFGPLFLSEMSPVNCRGKMIIGQQIMFSTGIFVSSVLGMRELLGYLNMLYYYNLHIALLVIA